MTDVNKLIETWAILGFALTEYKDNARGAAEFLRRSTTVGSLIELFNTLEVRRGSIARDFPLIMMDGALLHSLDRQRAHQLLVSHAEAKLGAQREADWPVKVL